MNNEINYKLNKAKRDRLSKEAVEASVLQHREKREKGNMKKESIINILIVVLTVLLGGIPAGIPMLIKIITGKKDTA